MEERPNLQKKHGDNRCCRSVRVPQYVNIIYMICIYTFYLRSLRISRMSKKSKLSRAKPGFALFCSSMCFVFLRPRCAATFCGSTPWKWPIRMRPDPKQSGRVLVRIFQNHVVNLNFFRLSKPGHQSPHTARRLQQDYAQGFFVL